MEFNVYRAESSTVSTSIFLLGVNYSEEHRGSLLAPRPTEHQTQRRH